ncbi:MAG: GNAT family N-acetyltransferase [Oscillospiraceae bacterium]|nr:GNAT family N-acetyltransferase [Oscillospiraceae bacterium]
MLYEVNEKLNDPLVRNILSACLFDNTPEGIDNAINKYPGELFYGWHENDELVAVCGFRVFDKKVEICHIAVIESSRYKGIGKAIISTLREKYGLAIEVETDDDAVGFYKKCGFQTKALYKKHGDTEYRRWICVLENG